MIKIAIGGTCNLISKISEHAAAKIILKLAMSTNLSERCRSTNMLSPCLQRLRGGACDIISRVGIVNTVRVEKVSTSNSPSNITVIKVESAFALAGSCRAAFTTRSAAVCFILAAIMTSGAPWRFEIPAKLMAVIISGNGPCEFSSF